MEPQSHETEQETLTQKSQTWQPQDWREGRRLRAYELAQQGWKQCRIAEALGVTKGAVTAIEEISTIINQISDISNSIASAVEEQTVTTNEIGRSVTEAALGVSDIAKNISGVAVAAKNTTQGANDTKTASLELSEMAARLQASVAKFTF